MVKEFFQKKQEQVQLSTNPAKLVESNSTKQIDNLTLEAKVSRQVSLPFPRFNVQRQICYLFPLLACGKTWVRSARLPALEDNSIHHI